MPLHLDIKGIPMRTLSLRLIATIAVLAACAAAVSAQTNSKEIMARPPAELVAILKNPDSSIFERAKACQQLSIVGTKDAVPALAALLADEHLNVYARCGLEGIADPAADAALRDAAEKLQGRPLVGVLGSIGQRRDAQAVELLGKLLESDDVAVGAAAACALGEIGTSECAALLTPALAKDSPIQADAAQACLVCAQRLAAAGAKPEAVALCKTLGKAELPKHLNIAALVVRFRIQGSEAKDLLLEQLRNPDEAYFNLGLAVARKMPGAETAAALVDEVGRLPAPRQALLLLALGDRPEPVPMALLLSAGKSGHAEVARAAMRLLAQRGDSQSVAVLLDAALGDAEVSASARKELENLAGDGVDAALLSRLTGAAPRAKAVLLEMLGVRQVEKAAPIARRSVADPNEAVRLAALSALGRLAGLDDLDLLAERALAATASATELEAARAALKTAALRATDRDGCAMKLAGRLSDASEVNRAYLLELLGKVGGAKALETVAAQVGSNTAGVKDAATRVLGEWPDAEAAPVLLDIAKNDDEGKYRIRALRGYLRIARQLQMPDEARLAMFRTAMKVSTRKQERRIALDILTRVASAASLNLAVEGLSDPELKDTAADAAVKIAAKLVARDPGAVASAMQKVVDAQVGGEVDLRAKQLLGQARQPAK